MLMGPQSFTIYELQMLMGNYGLQTFMNYGLQILMGPQTLYELRDANING